MEPTTTPAKEHTTTTTYRIGILVTALAAILALGIQAVGIVTDFVGGSLLLPIKMLNGATFPGATVAIHTATLDINPDTLSTPASTMLLMGRLSWTLAGAVAVIALGLVLLSMLKGRLATWAPSRTSFILATIAGVLALIAIATETMGGNMALADLGYIGEGIEETIDIQRNATSPWLWIAVCWALVLIPEAWKRIQRMAADTEGLI